MIYIVTALLLGIDIALGLIFLFTAKVFYQYTRQLECKITHMRQHFKTWATSKFANKQELEAFFTAMDDIMISNQEDIRSDIKKIRAIFDEVMRGDEE